MTVEKDICLIDDLNNYLEMLPKWSADGIDHINELAGFIVADNQTLFNLQFKKMLVRCVAATTGKKPNNHCFVLRGKLAIGKTRFLHFLCPPFLHKNESYLSMDIEQLQERLTSFDKGIIASLIQLSFINIEGISSPSDLKELFEIDEVTVHEFGESLSYPKTVNLLGTTNDTNLAEAEFGCLVFDVKSIIHDNGGVQGYNQNINIDLVWSQAYFLYHNGFDYNP